MSRKDPLLVAVEGVDGAGKTTLIRGLETVLRPLRGTRPARVCVEIFRAIAEPDDTVLHQAVIPGPVRRLAHLIELSAQLRYRTGPDGRPDLLFDRWIQSSEVHCGPYGEQHRPWLEHMEDLLPRPDPLLWLRVPPSLAYERMVARGDRRTRAFTPAALRAHLVEQADGYEKIMAQADNVVELDGTQSRERLLDQAASAIEAVAARREQTTRAGGADTAPNVLQGPWDVPHGP
ncbi:MULTISPECIES: thymidylate kinase [unclassified Parafrankia]|uniref:thymidylate kinase n=1 Tax=unclassified Parafrankia TaxID=2994368 RepID=UPI000DA4BAC8|nr:MULTISPECIES: thymidylate kinase [unclassified Parafrankia]TCJ36682.1 thymidylate kinase [Parafrankia sp. BMG5.11]CAI7975167.1 Thymidylate kinase-like protein [Frankia sp. Hr75.2]SQD97071.1 Thymidylate kinase-like protein [Parafrankia sp. Ea1.12]